MPWTPRGLRWLHMALGAIQAGYVRSDDPLAGQQHRQCSEKLDLQFIVGVDSCRDLNLMSRSYDPTKDWTRMFLLNGLSHANEILNIACSLDNG